MHKAARALHGEIVVVPFEHLPCDPWELARTLERELAAANAEVSRLRTIFRVNMLRLVPGVSHADIDKALGEAMDDASLALEARNAAVQRCAEIVAGLPANRDGLLATIRAEFPEAFK